MPRENSASCIHALTMFTVAVMQTEAKHVAPHNQLGVTATPLHASEMCCALVIKLFQNSFAVILQVQLMVSVHTMYTSTLASSSHSESWVLF